MKRMDLKVIQSNVNNSWASYDLLMQQAIEERAGLSESPRVQDSACRFSSLNGRAAIVWRPEEFKHGRQCSLVRKGRSCVIAETGGIWIISSYISPNSSRDEYLEALDEMEDVTRSQGVSNVIIGGDLNVSTWDPYGTNSGGQLVEELETSKRGGGTHSRQSERVLYNRLNLGHA